MKLATVRVLARPARGQSRLIAGSVAAAGALLLAAVHTLTAPIPTDIGLARYVTEEGLRPGVVVGTLLLIVPVLALTVQALRIGSVARDRRMAALRLAGATAGDARRIAAAEAGAAAGVGGVLAGPAYLLLWVLAGVLPPPGARLVDTPALLDAVTWAALIPLAAGAGALAGAAIHGRAIVEPLGVRRRGRPAPPGRASLVVLIVGIVLIAVGVVATRLDDDVYALLLLAMLGLLISAFAGGSRLVLGGARVLERRRGAEALLAGRRLRADPRSAGRVASVLVVCGIALGIDGYLAFEMVRDGSVSDAAFYFAGFGLAAVVALVAAAVAMITLLVGAADGLLDARRPLAALSALGLDERGLTRVLRRQLTVTAVPAIAIGALLGAPALMLLLGASYAETEFLRAFALALVPGVVTALVAGLVLALAARLAARMLRPLIRAAIDPENLRAA